MNWYDKAFVCVFFLLMIIVQASYQAHRFKLQLTISHFWKAFWYALIVSVLTIPYIFKDGWWMAAKIPTIGITIRAALFDLILNWIRGYKWYYNSAPGKKGSLLDRIENKLSIRWVKALKMVYIVAFIIVLIFVK